MYRLRIRSVVTYIILHQHRLYNRRNNRSRCSDWRRFVADRWGKTNFRFCTLLFSRRTRLVFRVRLEENRLGNWYRNVGIIKCKAFGVFWGDSQINVFPIVVVGPVTWEEKWHGWGEGVDEIKYVISDGCFDDKSSTPWIVHFFYDTPAASHIKSKLLYGFKNFWSNLLTGVICIFKN